MSGNLLDLQMTANQDPLVGDVAISGQSTIDGGGIGSWRDVATLQKYGVIQEEAFAFTHGDFNGLRRAAYQIVQNKITVGTTGAKIATVERDPVTADVWRELDKVTIDDKEQGINRFTSRILGYEFNEGSASQTMYLDQFSPEDSNGPIIIQKRLQQTVYEAISAINRYQGSGGGSGLSQPLGAGNYAAGGNQGGYSTANASTFTDITNTSFTLVVTRASLFEYRIYVTANITAGANGGYVRGNIVGFDTTSSPWIQGLNTQNGTLWYYPFNKGPIQPGTYTVKMQAATDNNATTVQIVQFFHQVFLYGV